MVAIFLFTASVPMDSFSQLSGGRESLFGNTPLVFTRGGRISGAQAGPTAPFNFPQLNRQSWVLLGTPSIGGV